MLDAEFTDDAMQLRRCNGIGGHHVVEVEDDAARVPERQVEASKRLDGERPGDIVCHRDIHLGDDRVSSVDCVSEAAAEQFLSDGSHLDPLCLCPADDQRIEGRDVERSVVATALHLGGEAA